GERVILRNRARTDVMAVDEEAKTASERKGTSRRTFVKAALAGGASAAAVGVAWTQFLSPKSQPSGTPPTLTPPPVTQYGSYLVWFDATAGTFRRKNLATGVDEAADANAGPVVQGAVDGLNPTVGGEIWISNDVDADDAIITIAGYMQYMDIDNLNTALYASGDGYSAIEFGNSNSGSGHIPFTGNTSLETEYDASGSPVVIKISTGAETGTPIRFENLSIVELGSRKSGTAVRPILLQSQTDIHKGLRLMHLDRLFFEQHYTSSHTIVTIEHAT